MNIETAKFKNKIVIIFTLKDDQQRDEVFTDIVDELQKVFNANIEKEESEKPFKVTYIS